MQQNHYETHNYGINLYNGDNYDNGDSSADADDVNNMIGVGGGSKMETITQCFYLLIKMSLFVPT